MNTLLSLNETLNTLSAGFKSINEDFGGEMSSACSKTAHETHPMTVPVFKTTPNGLCVSVKTPTKAFIINIKKTGEWKDFEIESFNPFVANLISQQFKQDDCLTITHIKGVEYGKAYHDAFIPSPPPPVSFETVVRLTWHMVAASYLWWCVNAHIYLAMCEAEENSHKANCYAIKAKIAFNHAISTKKIAETTFGSTMSLTETVIDLA